MKRILVLCTLGWVLLPSFATAQDLPADVQEFVRKLRENRYPDVAMEFLDSLKNPGPELEQIILLESARTRMVLARNMPALQRQQQEAKARTELEQFLKKNANHPEAVSINKDLAELSRGQGRAMLANVFLMRPGEPKQKAALEAANVFQQAGDSLVIYFKSLKDDPKRKEAGFNVGVVKMDQAQALIYAGENFDTKRGELVGEARKIFQTVADETAKEESKLGYLSQAWLVKACFEGDDPKEAAKEYKKLREVKKAAAEPGQRLVRLFEIEAALRKKPVEAERAKKAQDLARAWLKDYPKEHKSPEGFGVRYNLALAYVYEGGSFKEGSDDQTKRYAEAVKELKTQTEPDNDYAGKARQLALTVSIRKVDESTPLAELETFEQCVVQAQKSMKKMRELEEATKEAPSKENSEKLRGSMHHVALALSRARSLADANTPKKELDDASLQLVVTYYLLGDYSRCAIIGEYVGRTQPPTSQGALAAGYALLAYANLISRDPSELNRDKLRDLALYILSPECQKVWATEQATGEARFNLGLLYSKEGNTPAALEQIQQVPKEYRNYLYAQGKLVFMALEARDAVNDPAKKKAYADLARKVIAGITKLPDGTDSSSANMYFSARMEETKFLYADAADLLRKNDGAQAKQKFLALAALIDLLHKELNSPANPLKGERRDALNYYMDTMKKYGRLGLAEFEYHAGNYDKVLAPELAGAVVANLKQLAAKDAVIRLKDFQVTGDILGLALRANVQKGNIDEAKQLLKILQGLKGTDDNSLVETAGVLRNLFTELEIQIRDLQKTGDKEKLKKTLASFTEFIDAIHASIDPKKGLDKNEYFNLGRFYDILGQHEKSAKLYALYPAPKYLDDKKDPKKEKDKFTDEQEKELQKYWYAQVQQARQLRLSKKLPDAKKIVDALLVHHNARQQLMAEREANHILEDSGLYGIAITNWGQFMSNPGLKKNLATDPKLKEVYFDAYYHLTYCWFKYSQTDKVKAAGKEEQFLAKAVGNILRLETAPGGEGWQLVEFKFRELLQNEKVLNDAYKKQKGS